MGGMVEDSWEVGVMPARGFWEIAVLHGLCVIVMSFLETTNWHELTNVGAAWCVVWKLVSVLGFFHVFSSACCILEFGQLSTSILNNICSCWCFHKMGTATLGHWGGWLWKSRWKLPGLHFCHEAAILELYPSHDWWTFHPVPAAVNIHGFKAYGVGFCHWWASGVSRF